MKLAVWTLLLFFILAVSTSAEKIRAKRLVGIRKGSRFYLRMNFKDTILQATTIFAHAAGFKVTWDVPEGSFPKRSIRSLHDDIEFLFDRHGFDGKSCLLDNLCQATEYVSQRSGVMSKILRLFLRESSGGNDTSILGAFNCEDYRSTCPLDFNGIDTFLE